MQQAGRSLWHEETKWAGICRTAVQCTDKQCKNYRTISLISHPSKVMFQIILNRLKAKAEELPEEDQAGFRPGRSAVQQIFNSQVITEKHLQHQRDQFHKFIYFKKACDRVWHVGLWQVLRSFNMHEGLVQAIQALYENSSSAVLLNSQLGKIFKTIVNVPLGMLTLIHPVQLVPRENHAGNTP